MAEFFVERQCWAHWPKVLVMGRNRNDGTVERRRYVPERTCTVEGVYDYYESSDLWAVLSCGHEFEWNDDKPPAYCPECGAKVVNE